MGYFVSPDETHLDTLEGLDDLTARETSSGTCLELHLIEIHPDAIIEYPKRDYGKDEIAVMSTSNRPENAQKKATPLEGLREIIKSAGIVGRMFGEVFAQAGGAFESIFSGGKSKTATNAVNLGPEDMNYIIGKLEIAEGRIGQAEFNLEHGNIPKVSVNMREGKVAVDELLIVFKTLEGGVR